MALRVKQEGNKKNGSFVMDDDDLKPTYVMRAGARMGPTTVRP